MGLREIAEQDLSFIMEDRQTGWAWDITLTSPEGLTAPLRGLSNDISLAVDPDTGMLISGRTATATLRISSIRAAGFAENPRNISDLNRKPWIVGFKDINNVPCLFKVMKSNPDRTVGVVSLILEAYKQAVFYNGAWTFDGTQEYDGVLALL